VRNASLIELHDLNPTMTELAGVEPEPGIDGRSFRRLLTRPHLGFRDSVLLTHLSYRAIRTAEALYVQYNGDGEQELYDIREDPTEQRNIREQSPEQSKQLRQELRRRLHDYPSF
jgi:arylsulfatase A-like enzyme